MVTLRSPRTLLVRARIVFELSTKLLSNEILSAYIENSSVISFPCLPDPVDHDHSDHSND